MGAGTPSICDPGESLDFWRVRTVDPGAELGLEAEMRVPGRAWLSWRIEDGDEPDTLVLHQTAWFAPRGLWGRAYWYAMLPFHVGDLRRHGPVDHPARRGGDAATCDSARLTIAGIVANVQPYGCTFSREHDDRTDRVFHALADATRRDIIARTLVGGHSVTALAAQLHR